MVSELREHGPYKLASGTPISSGQWCECLESTVRREKRVEEGGGWRALLFGEEVLRHYCW